MKSLIPICFLLFGLSACSFQSTMLQPDVEAQTATRPQDVKVFAQEMPGFRYKVLGVVSVDAYGDGQDALDQLREKAASIGATAVVRLRMSAWFTNGRTGASGLAVKAI